MTNLKVIDNSYPFLSRKENSVKQRALKSSIGGSRKCTEKKVQTNLQKKSSELSNKEKPVKRNIDTKHKNGRYSEKQKKNQRIKKRLSSNNDNLKRLLWESKKHIPHHLEHSLLPILLHRGKNERGMMKDQSESRIQTIQESCSRNGIDIMQALSLRRHHIKKFNPYETMEALGLGSEKDIYNTAMKFEQTVRNYLMFQSNISFLTENDQRRIHYQSNGRKSGPTPDFLFRTPVIIYNKSFTHNMPINWLEAKMFYGASTIKRDEKSAVGRILTTAEKYVDRYGPGAIVFAYGCGESLAKQLKKQGVIALDATPLDLTIMMDEQRKWCADEKGRILI